jgi:hypothetical protein
MPSLFAAEGSEGRVLLGSMAAVINRFDLGIHRFARNERSSVSPELNLRAQIKRVESTLVVNPKGFCYEPVNSFTGGSW